MQVDWGDCGSLWIGQTKRRVSVFVAVLCYSRLCYIEFSLSQRKADFYRALVHALEFYQGSPRKVIFDNLKAAVTSGSGRYACLHPEFLALCGSFCMEPIACAARDPESKGTVEASVKYVKRNALAGRGEELLRWEDYQRFAPQWRDVVANVRLHATTKERPIDRFQKERGRLRPLPAVPFDTDEILPVLVTPHNAFNSREALETILRITVININTFVSMHSYNSSDSFFFTFGLRILLPTIPMPFQLPPAWIGGL